MLKYPVNIFLFLLIIVFPFMHASVKAETMDTAQFEESGFKSYQISASLQKYVNTWIDEKNILISKIRIQKIKNEWLQHQRDKYDIYIFKKEKALTDISERKSKGNILRQELEPWMETLYKSLASSVESDFPFLLTERHKRLIYIRESLDSEEVNTSEKLKRLLEALRIEMEYGSSTGTTQETININHEENLVTIIRIGRVGLYYVSADSLKSGFWNKKDRGWNHCGTLHTAAVKSAIKTHQNKLSRSIPLLPVQETAHE